MAKCFVKATDLITKAIEKDNGKNYKEALSLYSQGIQCLMVARKYEKNLNVRKSMQEKIEKYVKRVEEIKSKNYKINNKDFYATFNEQVHKQLDNADQSSKDLIFGFCHELQTDFPNEISKIILVYYYYVSKYQSTKAPNVKLSQVAGLKDVKQFLKETILLPIKYADYIDNTIKTSNNILIYGAPGVGKSFLTKAISNEYWKYASMFYLCASDLASKYITDGGEILKEIYDLAKTKKASIILIDEIDVFYFRSLSTLKQVFYNEVAQINNNNCVYTICTTSCPWKLNAMILRRFKKIYVPLPDFEARKSIFKDCVGDCPNNLSNKDYEILATKTNGFSCSDLSGLVQDAMMEPVRDIQNATHFKKYFKKDDLNDYVLRVCQPTDVDAIQMSLMQIPRDQQCKVEADELQINYFMKVINNSKPSITPSDIETYTSWKNELQ